jgi:ubiquinone/menaquinone biosynthesis C-methylase UbiE
MNKSLIHGWNNIKAQDAVDHYVNYLDAVSASRAGQKYKQQTFDLLHIKAGYSILDVGCGLGEDAQAMSALVGGNGLVVGVDLNEPFILKAKQRLNGLPLPVRYCLGDASRLGFASASFDGCRIDRTLLHIKNPQPVISEINRVCKSGSWIVASEVDWGTLIIDAPEKQLTQKILNYQCEQFANGWIGRQLPGLFQKTGLTDIQVIPDTGFFNNYVMADKMIRLQETLEYARDDGLITAGESSSWLRTFEMLTGEGRFFCSVTLFIVAGKKP